MCVKAQHAALFIRRTLFLTLKASKSKIKTASLLPSLIVLIEVRSLRTFDFAEKKKKRKTHHDVQEDILELSVK